MTSINYDDIFSYFLGEMNDYKLDTLDDEIVSELMYEWLRKSTGNPNIKKLFSTISFDDDNGELVFEIRNSSNFGDDEFVKNVFAKAMVCEWLKPKVRTTSNIAFLLTGKEQKSFSQANHLSELRGLLHDANIGLSKYIAKYGYVDEVYSEE